MNLLFELTGIVLDGLKQLSTKGLIITISSAVLISGLCWAFCNYYVLFWNKTFRLTITHQVLAMMASALTFFFVLAFSGVIFMKQIALAKITFWRADLSKNEDWHSKTFKEAFYGVKDLGLEKGFATAKTPENGGNFIPLTHENSQLEAASIYANNTNNNFNEEHPFLSKIIWSSAKIPKELIRVDIQKWFKAGNRIYPLENAVDLASNKIRDDLTEQTPRIVKLSRIALVILFLTVIMIPFGLIGYAAFSDIKVRV